MVCVAIRGLHRSLRAERLHRTHAERALRRTGDLESLATALSKSQTPAEVTHTCLSELLPAAAATGGVVALVNDEGNRLDVVQAMGYTESARAGQYSVTLESKTVMAEVVRRHAPLAFVSHEDRSGGVADVSLDPMLDEGEGANVMPLLVSGRTIGVVALSYQHAHPSDSDERAFLMGAVQRTAHALDRAIRYERAERARADLEAYRTQADIDIRERQRAEDALRESEVRYRALAARTTRLYTLSAGLSEAVTLDAVAKVIVRQGKVVAGAAAGSVMLLVDGDHFETMYSEDYPRELVETLQRFLAEPGLCATAAIETRRPVFIGSFLGAAAAVPALGVDRGGWRTRIRCRSPSPCRGPADWRALVPFHRAGEFRRRIRGAAHVGRAPRSASDRSRQAVRSCAARTSRRRGGESIQGRLPVDRVA